MDKLLRIVSWVVGVLVVLVLVWLGLRVAKLLLGVAVLVGLGLVLWILFGIGQEEG